MIKEVITETWARVVDDLLSEQQNYASEKTMVFNFAWHLKQSFKDEISNIDFERQLFDKFSDGTFLDLYFEFKNQRIGIEFKFPRKTSKGGSNSTQTRIKSVNDIKRLSYLANSDKIDLGVFLMAANEKAYILEGKKTKEDSLHFKIHKDYGYPKNCEFPIHPTKSKETVKNPIDINIIWNGINDSKLVEKISWINPIFIHK